VRAVTGGGQKGKNKGLSGAVYWRESPMSGGRGGQKALRGFL
jgi:hypothetical protein